MSLFGNTPVKHHVASADLAPLDEASLSTLNEPQDAVLRHHVAATEARLAARRAKEDYERVAARRGAAKADVDLAKAGKSAARAHTDVAGTRDAEQAIADARAEKDRLDLQVAWLRAEVAAADAHEVEANEAAWASEAELELARARLLAAHRHLGDAHVQAFVKQAVACRKARETARHRAAQQRAEADQQKNAWQLANAPELEPV